MFFVNVLETNNPLSLEYVFYYNMEAEVNKAVENIIGKSKVNTIYRSPEALKRIKDSGRKYLPKYGSAHLGMMGIFNKQSQQIEYRSALDMAGVCAYVSREIAEAVLEKAKYYCPVDTGTLKNSGYIEDTGDGQCLVKFDCPYAYFVHEFSWKNHKSPTTHHFLSIAVQEVMSGGV